jgi:hypothetical protein
MGMTKKQYQEWLDKNDKAQLELEIEKSIDSIIDWRDYQEPLAEQTKPKFDNACKHKSSEHPMALMGLKGMYYFCVKCGNPMEKFIPYNERPNND